jgi:hypothetical protein
VGLQVDPDLSIHGEVPAQEECRVGGDATPAMKSSMRISPECTGANLSVVVDESVAISAKDLITRPPHNGERQ